MLAQRARMLRATAQFAEAEAAFRACTSAKSRGFEGATPTYIAYAHNEFGHLLAQVYADVC
jgi:hypothetical protein